MPSHSSTELHPLTTGCSRRLLHGQTTPASQEILVHPTTSTHTAVHGPTSGALCGPQFQNRRGHISSPRRCGRLDDPDSGEVAEFSLPPVYPPPTRPPHSNILEAVPHSPEQWNPSESPAEKDPGQDDTRSSPQGTCGHSPDPCYLAQQERTRTIDHSPLTRHNSRTHSSLPYYPLLTKLLILISIWVE